MFNFIDIMRAAQGGQAIENMARKFGLTPDQTRHAVAALLPAFAMGLHQAAARPNQLEQLFEKMRSGRFDGFFENSRSAFSKKAQTSGEDVMSKMFGSAELARQIAEQSAAVSGVTAETAAGMMPLVASTLMGGMARSAHDQDFATVFGQMMKPLQPPEPPKPANPWEQMFGAMMASATGAAPEAPRRSDNPFEEMLAAMLRASAPSEPEPPPKSEAEKATEEVFANYQKMLQMGRELQDQHLAALRSIFDGFWARRS